VLYFLEYDGAGAYSAIRSVSFKTLPLPATSSAAIPALNSLALALLALLLAGGAVLRVRRGRD